MHFVLIIMHLLEKYVFGSMIYTENMFKSDFYMNIFGAWNHPSKFPIYLWFASSIKERIILVNQGITVTASILFYNCCQSRREACMEPKRWKANKSFFNVHTLFFNCFMNKKLKGNPPLFSKKIISLTNLLKCVFLKKANMYYWRQWEN